MYLLFIFGFTAILFTMINLFMYKAKKPYALWMGLALSFSVLAVWSESLYASQAILSQDASMLYDVTAYMHKPLLTVSIGSIVLNMIPAVLSTLRKSKP